MTPSSREFHKAAGNSRWQTQRMEEEKGDLVKKYRHKTGFMSCLPSEQSAPTYVCLHCSQRDGFARCTMMLMYYSSDLLLNA